MAEMNWFDYKKALEETDTVIVPIGSTEILGTHSPLGTDHLLAFELSKRLGEMTRCIVAPTIPVGDAIELFHWPGTITVRSHVLEELYRDICESLVKHGLKRIFFFNNHLSNIPGGRCRGPLNEKKRDHGRPGGLVASGLSRCRRHDRINRSPQRAWRRGHHGRDHGRSA